MAYILLDESGDLGFKFDKGSSNFFLITVVFVESKRPLEKIVKKVHSGLRKKFKKIDALHAYNETAVTKLRVLKLVNARDCAVLAIILNKRKVYTKLQDEKPVLNSHKLKLTVNIATPSQEKSLQALDFISWAIFRKYETGDESYYDLIKAKIVDETPLYP